MRILRRTQGQAMSTYDEGFAYGRELGIEEGFQRGHAAAQQEIEHFEQIKARVDAKMRAAIRAEALEDAALRTAMFTKISPELRNELAIAIRALKDKP
jgi:flagellar biosynthesis/type III secretory pathway protein FliH